jgi:hypothetical protein
VDLWRSLVGGTLGSWRSWVGGVVA